MRTGEGGGKGEKERGRTRRAGDVLSISSHSDSLSRLPPLLFVSLLRSLLLPVAFSIQQSSAISAVSAECVSE
eukprot:3270030-Rhodomonas_salina.1